MLAELLSNKHIVTRTRQVDVCITAPGGVITVSLRKTCRAGVATKNVRAIDLEFQRRRCRPNKASHTAISDGHALLASGRRLRVIQIRPPNERLVINIKNSATGWSANSGNQKYQGGHYDMTE